MPDDRHVNVRTFDGNVHVIPLSVIQRFVRGDMALDDIDDGPLILRAITAEWLRALKRQRRTDRRPPTEEE